MTEDKTPDLGDVIDAPAEEAPAEEEAKEATEETPASSVTSAVVDVTGTDAANTGEMVEGNPNHV